MSGSFSATLTEDDWVASHWLLLRKGWLWRKLILATLSVSLFYGLLLITVDFLDFGFNSALMLERLVQGLLYGPAVVAILVVITIVLTPIRMRRTFKQLGIEGRESRYEFDGDGIRWENKDSTASFDWARFQAWAEDGRVMILQMSDVSYVALPKQQIAAHTLSELKETLREAGVRQR